jgi:hypothetical protein
MTLILKKKQNRKRLNSNRLKDTIIYSDIQTTG